MPISNPSYFPPNSGTDQIVGINAGKLAIGSPSFLAGQQAGNDSTVDNLIIIGHLSGSGGITDNANLNGTIIIGHGTGKTLTVGVGNGAPLTLIGYNSLSTFTSPIDSTVVVGSNILNGASFGVLSKLQKSVYVGNNLFAGSLTENDLENSVVIGDNIGAGANGNGSFTQASIFIGANMFASTFATDWASSIFIGGDMELAGSGFAVSGNVFIGDNIHSSAGPAGNVGIGVNIAYTGTASATTASNVCLGSGITYNGNNNTVIGTLAVTPLAGGSDASFGHVIIGSKAGTTVPSTVANNTLLVIESQTSTVSAVQTLAYGFFANGNLILGNSVEGTNRDLGGVPGTNMLKLLNGTAATGANVSGGGYFYVSAGALHWVGSAGTDTPLAVA